MYIPKQFESPSHALTLDVMRTHDFATLISSDVDGLPVGTPLPVVVSELPSVSEDPTQTQVILHFHLARANPHVALLREGRPTMVAFSGPNAYMSPSVYADLKRVPTWNYIAVHAYGGVEEVTSAEDKDALLKSLISIHEPDYAAQWKGLDHEFQHAMLGAIAGFRMTVTRLDSKFKINQHRKEAHAQMKATYVTGSPDEQALAQWMTRLGF